MRDPYAALRLMLNPRPVVVVDEKLCEECLEVKTHGDFPVTGCMKADGTHYRGRVCKGCIRERRRG